MIAKRRGLHRPSPWRRWASKQERSPRIVPYLGNCIFFGLMHSCSVCKERPLGSIPGISMKPPPFSYHDPRTVARPSACSASLGERQAPRRRASR
jgi:hypothetical protein